MNLKQSIVEMMVLNKEKIEALSFSPVLHGTLKTTNEPLSVRDLVLYCKHWCMAAQTGELKTAMIGLCSGFVEWVGFCGLYTPGGEMDTFDAAAVETAYHERMEDMFGLSCPWVCGSFLEYMLPFNEDLASFTSEENFGYENPKRIAWVEAFIEVFGEGE